MSRKDGIVATGLVLLTLALFAPAARHAFLNYDDPEYVVENRHVSEGVTRDGIAWAFTHAHSANWHPVTWLSHMLDCELFGLRPAGHHLTSVVLHAVAAGAAFAVFRVMTGALWPSAFLAALFALHPLRVESVAWVAERKDVLSGLCWMLALGAYVAWVRRPTPRRYAVLLLAFACGLLAKPMVVTLPFVLLLLDWWPLRRAPTMPRGRLLVEKIPLFVLAAAASVVTFVVQQQAGAVAPLAHVGFGARLANAVVSYALYVWKTVWPTRLAVFYPYVDPLPGWQVAVAGALLVAVSVLTIREARRWPYLVVGWLWFVGTLVPVIQLVRAGDQAMADRFTYLPSLGLFVIAAFGAADVVRALRVPAPLATAAAVGVLVACAAATTVQLRHWRNDFTLFEHALAVTTDNYVAHTNLGEALLGAGRDAEAATHFAEALRLRPGWAKAHVNYGKMLAERGEHDAAAAEYAAALEVDPRLAMAHYNWGVLLAETGHVDEAIGHYREALARDPEYAKAYTNLGWALARQGRLEEAVSAYREALRLRPGLATAHNNLAVALEDLGRTDDAIAHYREAVRLTGDPRSRFNLAAVLRRAGRLDDAIEEYRAILRTDPSLPEPRRALASALVDRGQARAAVVEYRDALRRRPSWPAVERELAWLLATHPDAAIRDGRAAVELAEHAAAENGTDPAVLDTLAAAYAEAGRFAEAVEAARRAGARAREAGDAALARDIEDRERLYRAGRGVATASARLDGAGTAGR